MSFQAPRNEMRYPLPHFVQVGEIMDSCEGSSFTKKKVVTTRLENIYSTDAFDTLKNGKLRSQAPIIPQSPARLQKETFSIVSVKPFFIFLILFAVIIVKVMGKNCTEKYLKNYQTQKLPPLSPKSRTESRGKHSESNRESIL